MGATYTRQSGTEIVDGEIINAADFNNEFNQILAAFAVSTGHSHDGTAAEGGPVTKLLGTAITIGDGTAGTDIAVTFDGESADGVLTWMEDEDQFKFADDVMIVDNEALILGTDSNITIKYDEATNDALEIAANVEGAPLAIVLKADQGDDAGDEWKINVADGGVITFGNDLNSAGTYVTHMTMTPNATVANSTIAAAGNLTVANDLTVTDDVILDSDQAVLKFGDSQEITVTHVADTGLRLKHTATADDKPIVLTLQTGEEDIALNDVIGRIDFQAPDETTGTDAILVAAGIAAVSEGDFSSSNNATKLSFRTAASETATEKMSLSSAGNLTISGDLTVSGDDLTMGTNTSGAALIGDGTNFNPVVISGDIAIGTTGTAAISTGVIVNADISSTAAIDPDKFDLTAAADGTGITIAAGDLFLVADADDSNTVKKVNASQINTYTSAVASSVAADNITTGDASTTIQTSSGAVLIDSNASTTTIDGHTGITLQNNSNDITVDSAADIVLDAGGADIILKDDGTTFGSLTNTGGELVLKSGSTPTVAATFAGDDVSFADDVALASDSAALAFGANSEIKLIHSADTGLLLKHTATGDGTPVSLTLQTGEVALTVGEPLGTINFQAPDEAGGTDSILVAAAIEAVAEGTFAADNNATKLIFKTGASEAASQKMAISSVGNVTMKNTATTDDTPVVLTLQTGETDIALNDVIGKIDFQAPDEATGTDAILVAAGIAAVSEGDFSSSNNATKLSFKTGASEAASEKMSLSSAGLLTVADDIMIKDGGTIGVASVNDSITISSAGIVTFKDDIVIKDGGTIGTGTTPAAMTVAAAGAVTFSAVPLFPNDTVETADIQDNAVSLAKMAGLARGKIIYGDASGDPAALAVGTADQVLTSDGTDISWATASGGISEANAIGLIIALG